MNKNQCPYCGERISAWKKWQLTDNRYGRRCPHCNNVIVLLKLFVRFVQVFNIAAAIFLVYISYRLESNSFLFLLGGAVVLVLINLLILRFPEIKKIEK